MEGGRTRSGIFFLQCSAAFAQYVSLAEFIGGRFEDMRTGGGDAGRNVTEDHYWHTFQKRDENAYVLGMSIGRHYGIDYRTTTLYEFYLLLENMIKEGK